MHFPIQRLAAAALALTASVVAFAYNIRGTVAESGTSEPLIQASVRLLAARDSAIVKTAVSDIDGRFSIADVKPGRYIVEASYVGYTRHRPASAATSTFRRTPVSTPYSSALAASCLRRLP